MVCQRVRAAAVVYDSAEGRALSPSRPRSPSPCREGSLPDGPKRDTAPVVTFHVVTEVDSSTLACLPACLSNCLSF